jgi:hypothetical protein
MYRDFKRYVANDKDRRTLRYWILGCAIIYGLPLLHFVGVLAFAHHANVSLRAAEPASMARAAGPRSTLTP